MTMFLAPSSLMSPTSVVGPGVVVEAAVAVGGAPEADTAGVGEGLASTGSGKVVLQPTNPTNAAAPIAMSLILFPPSLSPLSSSEFPLG